VVAAKSPVATSASLAYRANDAVRCARSIFLYGVGRRWHPFAGAGHTAAVSAKLIAGKHSRFRGCNFACATALTIAAIKNLPQPDFP
jgi:hypothetical protein